MKHFDRTSLVTCIVIDNYTSVHCGINSYTHIVSIYLHSCNQPLIHHMVSSVMSRCIIVVVMGKMINDILQIYPQIIVSNDASRYQRYQRYCKIQ